MYQYKYFITNTLPYEDIKTNIYKKVNNKTSLEIVSSNGIPYGTIARIILLYIITQVIKQQSRKILIGNSFSDFMKKCGYLVSGGSNGSIARFKEQWNRLLSSTFTIKDLDGKIISFSFTQQNNTFNKYLEISESFYNHLIKNKIYIDEKDINLLQNGKHGSLILDLYSWLIYRRYTIRKFTNLKYKDLQSQFGTGIKDLAVFKAKLRQSFIVLATILNIYKSFSEESFNIIDFSVKAGFSKISKFQKYLKKIVIQNKYKLSISFQKNSLFLSPDIFA